jgi:CheY-like chemotaxis protein/HPt (histidine-containing phosphotransfer) domain-containing protein
MMGGRIWVESEVGIGSTFHFTIRAKPAVTEVRSVPTGSLAGRRVLIVDDNETNRLILTERLQKWKMQPFEACDGLEALHWLETNDPVELAILDYQMPEMDGVELAREIRAKYPDVPIVILSSVGKRVKDASIDAFMNKPVKHEQLHKTLTRVVGVGEAESSTSGEAGSEVLLGERHPLRILLAEDVVVNQQVAVRMLDRLGYTADVVSNGREALEAVKASCYDVVFMDMQMPEMDGLESTRRIRAEADEANQPYIIAMTANAMAGDREKCLESGMNDYVSKPAKLERMSQALERSPSKIEERHRPEAIPSPQTVVVAKTRHDPEKVAAGARQVIAHLNRLSGDDDPEFRRTIMLTFLETASTFVSKLMVGFEEADVNKVQYASHSLKSSSQLVGASRLSSLCFEVESQTRSGTLDGLQQHPGLIQREFESLQEILSHALSISG